MIRLILMPLVEDFGEFLKFPGSISPKTQLVFTRDCRIFGQFQHFPDVGSCEEDVPNEASIIPKSLPLNLSLSKFDDEEGKYKTRKDGLGYDIVYVHAGQLKKLVLPENTTPTNKAIKAYVDSLPNDVPIIMEWD